MMTRRNYSLTGLILGLLSACASSAGGLGGEEEAVQLGAVSAALEEGATCLVPPELLEHACQHAQFGPFVSATAQPYPGFVFTEISAPHTVYELGLPGSSSPYSGGVIYLPAVSGEHAFFTTPQATVSLYDSANALVPVEREGLTDPQHCEAIEKASVFHLDVNEVYTVVFGPEADPTVRTIVEYLGEGGCEACEHVHLNAYRRLFPKRNDSAHVVLDEPIAFEVPAAIAVTTGRAKSGEVTLEFKGPGPRVECTYRADRVANTFTLKRCSRGVRAGHDVEAREFKLTINKNAVLYGPVGVELELEDESCHEHEHEHEHE